MQKKFAGVKTVIEYGIGGEDDQSLHVMHVVHLGQPNHSHGEL